MRGVVPKLLLVVALTFLAAGVRAQQPAKKEPAAPPSPADVAFAAAQATYKKKDFAEARTSFQTFTTKFSTDARVPQALFLKGMCEMSAKQASAALNTWNWLLANHARSGAAADAMEQIALHYESNGQMNKVEEMIDKLVANFPAHPATARLCTKRGEALFEAKKYAECVKVLGKVEKQLKPATLNKLAVAKSMLSGIANPQALLEEANAKLETNEAAAAIMLYERYLKEFPKSPGVAEAKTHLGWCFYISSATNRYDRAEQQWKEVIQKGQPNDPWVGESRWHMVQLLAGPRYRWEEAVKECDAIIKDFPKGSHRHEQAIFSKAWLLWTKKEWAESRSAFDDLIAAYPEKTNHPPIMEYIEDCDKNLAAGKKSGK